MLETPDNLESIIDAIEVPDSYYDLARERYRTIGEHLMREDSTVRQFAPYIHSQGSFRIGTAIRPLGDREEFDVDLVCRLNLLTKDDITQAQLRKMVAKELELYTVRYGMNSEPRDRPRCVTLDYAGKPAFHVDVLPCVPEDQVTIQEISLLGEIRSDWAVLAIAITDRDHPEFAEKTGSWPSSNPDAYGRWFVERMNLSRDIREAKGLAELPVYKRKLPLQRAVQLLKRHCCTFFSEAPTYRPISTIITTLAARLYLGERTVEDAFFSIVPGLSEAITRQNPTVVNPVNPRENFADKWSQDGGFYSAYQDWCCQLNQDLDTLRRGDLADRRRVAEGGFKASPRKGSEVGPRIPRVQVIRTPVASSTGEKPWKMGY